MKKEFLDKVKKELEEKKERLESGLKGFAKKDEKTKGDWDTNYPKFERSSADSLEESADEVEEYGNLLPVEHSLELKLVDVNSALDKIKKNKYGICEVCKKEISIDRLKASPEAKTCIKCNK